MSFRKQHSNITIVRAMIQGVIIGVVAVAAIGLAIVGTGGKGGSSGVPAPTKTVPASGPQADGGDDEQAMTMYVKQHGVFSSAETAAGFVSDDPSLAKTAILKVGDQYYVWGAVGLNESDIVLKEGENAFRKTIRVTPSSCKTAKPEQLKKTLLATDLSKMKLSDEELKSGDLDDFEKKLTAVTAFTDDLSIARLHLLSHYSQQEPCFKIQF